MAMWEVGLNLPGVARLHLMDTQVLARMSRSPSSSGWLIVDQGTLLGRCISVSPDNLGVSVLNSSLPCLRTLERHLTALRLGILDRWGQGRTRMPVEFPSEGIFSKHLANTSF